MAKCFTMAQMKEQLDIHENTIVKNFTNRFKILESKIITNMPKENKDLKDEVKHYRNQQSFKMKHKKMKKDTTEDKQKLETNYRNNEGVQNLIQQNTEIKEQIS